MKFSLKITFSIAFLLPCLLSLLHSSYPVDTIEEGFREQHTTALTIAGSDPSGGAGIQADLKTFSALRCYGMSVITALTAQNTQGVQAIQSLPAEFIQSQMQSVFNDIEVNAMKVGMLERREIIETVATFLRGFQNARNIVIDPVMFSKTGHLLLAEDAVEALKQLIVPLATILTPNTHEAAKLLGISIKNEEEMLGAALNLLALGPQAVIVKGGSCSPGNDCLVIKGRVDPLWIRGPAINTRHVHGTGCSFSAAITSYLAQGEEVLTAVQKAKDYINGAIADGSYYQLGKGVGPVNHFYAAWPYQYFTQKAWLETMPLFRRIQEHPFIEKMADNSLESEIFSFYVQQDHLFLAERAKAFAILAARAPSVEVKDYLTLRAQQSWEASEGIFEKYAIDRPSVIVMSPACKDYTEYMVDIAQNGGFLEGLTAQLPCSIMYQKLGEHLRSNFLQPNKFVVWVNTYSSPERRKTVEVFVGLVDKVALSDTHENIDAAKRAFQKASQYEFEFWDGALNLRHI